MCHHAQQQNEFIYLLLFFVVLGVEPRGIPPSSYILSPILFLVWKQGLTRLMRVSLLTEAVLEPEILLSQPSKYKDYRYVLPHLV